MRQSSWKKRGVAILALAGAAAAPAAARVLELEPVVDGLSRPLGVTHAGDGSGRLFILEQGGAVRIHDGDGLLEEPFLDLAGQVSCCGERGLLGLAFHPDYAANGLFYVDYTDAAGRTVVSRFRVSDDPDRALAGSESVLLSIDQPFSNHNGGHLAFGPDGYLYIASGDGGSGGDPQNNAQSLDTLLGKLLRIDVDGAAPYAVPEDNPFLGDPGAQGEIWAYGLRNPWRFSFDRATGDLYVGDVGQSAIEEIDLQPAASGGGENYGWRVTEGSECFEPPTGCATVGLTPPILEYGHDLGCSVTGGFRYRGPAAPTLPRFYVFGDFCSGRIWGGIADSAGRWRSRELLDSDLSISSFGEDEAGRLYVVDLGGAVHRLVGRPLFASDFESGDTDDWSRRRGGLAVVEPGLAGSGRALEVPVDGTRRKRFVRSNEPDGESTFSAAFRLSANRVDLGGGEVEILRFKGRPDPLRLTLSREGRRYRVGLWVRENGGAFELVDRVRVPRRRAVRLEVELLRARTPGGSDGEATLYKRGRPRARATDLANGRLAVEAVVLGLPSGSAGAVSGSFLIDDYSSSP